MSEAKKPRKPRTPKAVQNTTQSAMPAEIKNEQNIMVRNGLSEAIMGEGWGTPGFGAQLSQVDTLFKNNRWYLVSNMRQLLSEIYVEHGLVQTVVDVPVDDGMRGGVEIKSKQLDESQIEELHTDIEQEGVLTTVGQGEKWNRLFGGAGIVIMTGQDSSTPLDWEAIKPDSLMTFRAVDMWELFSDRQGTGGDGSNVDALYSESEFYQYYSLKLHKSRVIILKGLMAPSFVRPRLRGWGFSIIETLVRSINQYLKSTNLTFEVLDEFKLDIFKIKNLTNTLLSPNGEQLVRKRVALANSQKNFQNALTMDSEDDYVQKQLSFAGLAEAQQGIRLQVASDMRMPLSKIFGISAQGFNSGEDDIENYNGMVESQVREKSKYVILKLLKLMCQKRFGFVPDDLKINFKPLRVLSAVEEENVKTQKFTRALQAKQANEINALEFRDICNRGNLLDIQLDTDQVTLDDLEPDDTGITDTTEVDENSVDLKKKENSIEFDLAAFKADGGEGQFDLWKKRLYDDPTSLDKAKFQKAKAESQKVFGKDNWQFILWCYQEQGGKLR